MRESKYRVYCEFELNGELHKSMESPASWFLLTQTGKLWTYDPGETPRPLEKNYKKAIPLFYTGLKEKIKNGKEIYEGDIVKYEWYPSEEHMGTKTEIKEITFNEGCFKVGEWAFYECMSIDRGKVDVKIIGNIYENPELLNSVG